MDSKQKQLLKHFASVLRNRANADGKQTPVISDNLLKFFSRKELIEVIRRMYGGSLPKDMELVELENRELLSIIGDEMYILSFLIDGWQQGLKKKPVPASVSEDKPPRKSNTKKN